jgi:transposase
LRKALSEPIPTDYGYYRGWETQGAIQFVTEEFKISYSKPRMRQIIKDLGYRKLTYKPR